MDAHGHAQSHGGTRRLAIARADVRLSLLLALFLLIL